MGQSKAKQWWLGFYLMLMAVLLAYLTYALWPTAFEVDGEPAWQNSAVLFGKELSPLDPEVRFILLVMLIGALGSYIHAATSFVTFVGNRSLVDSWMWWYFLRPFIGMSLATIFYFAIRGGFLFLSSEADINQLSPFGIAAISGLVGMFSKQAIDKLKEVFDNLFRTAPGKGDDERANKLVDMRPVRDIMLGASSMEACKLEPDESETDVTIDRLHNLLGGVVTRIPVLSPEGAVKYVIHQSLLYKFIAERSIKEPDTPVNITELTLENFLSTPNMRKIVGESMAFVSANSVLGEAKQALESTANCQDVFITENGKREEPVVGWLTNIDISKHAKA